MQYRLWLYSNLYILIFIISCMFLTVSYHPAHCYNKCWWKIKMKNTQKTKWNKPNKTAKQTKHLMTWESLASPRNVKLSTIQDLPAIGAVRWNAIYRCNPDIKECLPGVQLSVCAKVPTVVNWVLEAALRYSSRSHPLFSEVLTLDFFIMMTS